MAETALPRRRAQNKRPRRGRGGKIFWEEKVSDEKN